MLDAMNDEIVKAMYETLPVEITVIDADDRVIGWNRHDDRLFYRPETSMGADFRECHPAESLDRVERIVADMKSGGRDRAEFWIDLIVDKATGERHKVAIEFRALRDSRGRYLGCMECTTDIERYRRLEGERRLLDED
ncbi:MAG TPA: PAS domain-containing protein [Rectinemataceae bacterium]|nr:PAS domain-containing protein [Rectinemataceae bacterium]